MFSTNFRYNTKKTGKSIKELPITENRTEKLLLVHFLFLGRWSKNYSFFSCVTCNISAYAKHFQMKFSIHTKFDTLISNLNLYVQCKIVMTLL